MILVIENYHDENGVIPFHQYYANDFGLIDFMDEANVNHLIGLIRGETINQPENHPYFQFLQPIKITSTTLMISPPPLTTAAIFFRRSR